MKSITTYYASNKGFLVRLAALLSAAAFVSRIVFAPYAADGGFWVILSRVILPAAVNLLFAVQLISQSEKRFFVTRGPVLFFGLYYLLRIKDLGVKLPMTLALIALVIVQCALYEFTYIGRIKHKWFALIAWLIPGLFVLDERFVDLFLAYWDIIPVFAVMDLATVAAVIFAILASKAMPEWKEGDPYRLRPGDRLDGRLVRTRNPMDYVGGNFMIQRNESDNWIIDSVECTKMEKYIREKRKAGLKHFGITHVIIAAYTRALAEYPGGNRFFMAGKTYSAYKLVVNMMAKKEMKLDGQETLIKVTLDRGDSAEQVYEKYEEKLNEVISEGDHSFDHLMSYINFIPRLFLRFVVWILKVMDYFGALPEFLTDLSPMHGSMFITSMGSLGIPPIWHHLYDFGNVPAFCAFGARRSVNEIEDDGTVVKRRYLDFTWVVDERIIDGHYYSTLLKRVKYLMAHPEKLDGEVEVKEDIQ